MQIAEIYAELSWFILDFNATNQFLKGFLLLKNNETKFIQMMHKNNN